MNGMPKHVASRTLRQAEWNASIIEGDLGAEIATLKEQPGGDLLIYGSGDLVDELTRLRLIDEYRLMVYPVIVGTGKRLFSSNPEATLELTSTVTTATGVVVATYRLPAGGDPR
jgi:dihydrofolate reductase